MKWTLILVLVVAVVVVTEAKSHYKHGERTGERNEGERNSHAVLETKYGRIKENLVSLETFHCIWPHFSHKRNRGRVFT